MRRLSVAWIAAVCSIGMVQVASAADLPVKAPRYAPPPPPVYSWTGFYVGANVGYGVARNPSDSIFGSGSHGETFNLSPQGVFGGAQFGYNWQAAPNWVLGIETDFQASAQKDSTTCVDLCILPSGGSPGVFTQVSQKLPWFGTLRARLGWTNGPTLYYVTGGWAYGEVKTDYAVGNVPGTDAHSFSHTKSGWTIGGGIETQLVGNWTAKVEYLYIDLGTVNEDFVYAPDPSVTIFNSSEIRNHVVRVGVNYKFGMPVYAATARPGIYKAPVSAFNWSGFYVGGNIGYGVARDPSQSIVTSGGVPLSFDTFNLSPRGVLGGIQAGFNWQAAPNWVWSIESDIQASGQTDSTTCVGGCQSVLITQVSQKLPWFGTLRGRVGWTNGPALYYVTGGWAYGQVNTDYLITTLPNVVVSRGFSHIRSGWTIGGGIESQLIGNWTLKGEYLYVDLGKVNDSVDYPPDPFINLAESSSIRNHVARVGLNYKFGAPY